MTYIKATRSIQPIRGKHPVKAVIYARFSSDRQSEDSIEAQIRACSDYAAAKSIQLVGSYIDEAISGKGSKTASRAQYQRMLRDCDNGIFDAILIHKYDRVARNIGEHVALEKRLANKQITLIAVAQDFGSSNEAKIMRTLMWALSEYYIDNLADETRKGHKETAIKGLHNGGCAPFGYDIIDQAYVINEMEAPYVRRIFECAANREGFVDIIREMDECGIRGKRGKPIKYTQIYEILRNEKYTGTYIYSTQMEEKRVNRRSKPTAIRIENALPIIIEKPLFEEVQRIMDERKQTGKKAGYLCSGLVYCECGAKMHGTTTHRKGHAYPQYMCSKKCGNPAVKMPRVDEAAVGYLQELLSSDNQTKIADALRRYQDGEQSHIADFNAAIQRKIREKQTRYDTLMDNLSAGALPSEVINDIGQKMQALKEEINALREATPPKDFTVDQIKAWLEALKAASDEKAIHLLIERIDAQNAQKNTTEFNIYSTLNSVVGEIGRGDRI